MVSSARNQGAATLGRCRPWAAAAVALIGGGVGAGVVRRAAAGAEFDRWLQFLGARASVARCPCLFCLSVFFSLCSL